MANQLAWKVVRRNGKNRFESAIEQRKAVRYVKNKWVEPLGDAPQCLFTFSSRQHARKFKKAYEEPSYKLSIFRCVVKNPSTQTNEINSFNCPKGTLFVKAVKILG